MRGRKYIDREHVLGSEAPIVVLLFRLGIRVGLCLRRLSLEHMNSILVRGVYILLFSRHIHLNLIALFRCFDHAKISGDLVIAFRTP